MSETSINLPSIAFGQAILTDTAIRYKGQDTQLGSVSDFVNFLHAAHARIITSLVSLFGSESQELHAADDGKTMYFQGDGCSETQLSTLIQNYAGDSQEATLIIGWCVQAYAHVVLNGGLDSSQEKEDFVPVAYIVNRGWRAAFVTDDTALNHRRELDAWNAIAPTQRIIISMESGYHGPEAIRSDFGSGIHPWPFSCSDMTPFDMGHHLTDVFASDEHVFMYFLGHKLSIPRCHEIFDSKQQGSWRASLVYKGRSIVFRAQGMPGFSTFRRQTPS